MRALLLTLTTCLFVLPAYAKYSGGTGEPNDPYQIATAADLILLGETPADYDKHFLLTADIDLDPKLPGRKVFDEAVIAPDKDDATWWLDGIPFTGVFDGRSHTISHLTIKGGGYLGLFGQLVSGAEVKSLGVVDVNITGSGDYVGGLIGWNEEGAVTQCHSTGVVSGKDDVGALIGSNWRSNNPGVSVTYCYSIAVVSGEDSVGGLVGANHMGLVRECYSTGVVNGSWYVGGLAGENYAGLFTECYSTAAVSGCAEVGGLVGTQYIAILLRCYSTGVVKGNGEYVGGLVGINAGTVIQCYGTGVVSGKDCVGGLVGRNSKGLVRECYGTGAVSGEDSVGGLVGENALGGCVTHCYSIGAVSGGSQVGGLVGDNWSGIVIDSVWDTQTSHQATSDGGTGKPTPEMQDIRTYLDAGWDFVNEVKNGTSQIWRMPQGGYPSLAVFNGYTPPQLEGCGTAEDPYLLSDAAELGAVVYYSPFAHYRLGAPIDLSGIRWGTAVIPVFGGTFDGNDLSVSHLTVKGGACLGLFGILIPGAAVKALGVVDVNITGSGRIVGTLVGANGGTVTVSYSTGVVSGYECVGGLVGVNSGDLTVCYSTAGVSGQMEVGGLVGVNSGGGSVTNCHSTATISGGVTVGGLVGCNYQGSSVTDCHSTATISGIGSQVGGLVGENLGNVIQCHSTGAISGIEEVGGLVGSNNGSRLEPSSLTCCYSTATVSGFVDVGGLVGQNTGALTRCYSGAVVSGNNGVGGLLGSNSNGFGGKGIVTDCFWDTQTSGQATSAGGTGKTTAEMQTASTFLEAGWDFVGETGNGTEDIWWIDEGKDYPRLWWEVPAIDN